MKTRSKATAKPSVSSRTRKSKPTPRDEELSGQSLPASEKESDVEQPSDDEDIKSLHSDALDDDDGFKVRKSPKTTRKRKRPPTPKSAKKDPASNTKKKRLKKHQEEQDEDESNGSDFVSDDEHLQVVGKVVQAPKTGRVPPGQISQNTFDFLLKLQDSKCNDREWFKLHDLVYRQAETEWKDFIEKFTTLITEADPQIPHLPPKDVVHRIYRDIRFSNDKTPYKTNLSASFSRSGRKGIFAGYHLSIKPGGNSILAAGSWCPGRNELATIRSHILRDPSRIRTVLSLPAFVSLFGEAKPHPKGQRRSIFGMEDELKVAPKGLQKDHPDIDLLKCRSFAVVHKLKDEEVLSPGFADDLMRIIRVMRPLVYCINDYMTVAATDDEAAEDDD